MDPAGSAALGHRVHPREGEPGLVGIEMEPSFAIGQRELLVLAPGANVLWDCISLLGKVVGADGAAARCRRNNPDKSGEWGPDRRLSPQQPRYVCQMVGPNGLGPMDWGGERPATNRARELPDVTGRVAHGRQAGSPAV